MMPPSTLLQLNAILVLFCAAAMLFTNVANGQPPPPQPPPQQDKGTLGLGEFPVPAEKEEIDLPSGIVLVNDKTKFDEYYKDAKVKPCNVDFDKDGNIEVFYDDLASSKGCTMDLLVNKTDQIEFVAKVEDNEKKCVTLFENNLLPFIFNEANNGLTTLTNGPIAGDEKDCAKKKECDQHHSKCIKRTMFGIGWKRVVNEPNIFVILLQVGEPISQGLWGNSDGATMDVKMAVGNVPGEAPLVTITSGGQSFIFPGRGGNPVCNHPRKATPPPAIWKVKSGNQKFNGKYFVTFHFFAQMSAAGGPKCKASFIFSKDFALGIPTIPKPQPTTTKTTIGSTTTTEIKSTTTTKIRTTKAATKIRSTKAATKTGPRTAESTAPTTKTTPPGTTEPADGPPLAMITGIVYGYLLLITIIVAVEAYCLFCRKRKDEFVPTEYFYITRRERALMGLK